MESKILITSFVYYNVIRLGIGEFTKFKEDNMKKLFIAGILGIFFLTGWKSEEKIITETGTIKYIQLEGGFYGIVTEKGGKYLPVNLKEEFKKDGLRIWFKARPKKVATIQMWGKPIEILEIQKIREKKVKNFSQIKVAVLYERIGDGKWINRSVEDEIKIFKETNTDFILRAFWRWASCPEKFDDLPEKLREKFKLKGYSYSHLEKTISKIKKEIPGIIICGAIPAQIIQRKVVWNPQTKEIIRYPETWNLALDPSKWKIDMSKEELQCRFAKTHFWVPQDLNCRDYNPDTASAYFPDITNKKFQELLLSWAKRQIDAGVDAVWIDMLFRQVIMLYRITRDFNHPAVKESYESAWKIVKKIHQYGEKKGKDILVGSWPTAIYFPYPLPGLDFVTLSPSRREVREMKLDGKEWDKRLKLIRKKFGNIPIFAFIDWAGSTKTPLGEFSQVLTKEEQKEFLRKSDEFFSQRNVIFAFPVHGGFMGHDAKVLSFGKSRVYDSFAPEFKTYKTIKNLAQSKCVGKDE